jgi:hypothetical protein
VPARCATSLLLLLYSRGGMVQCMAQCAYCCAAAGLCWYAVAASKVWRYYVAMWLHQRVPARICSSQVTQETRRVERGRHLGMLVAATSRTLPVSSEELL